MARKKREKGPNPTDKFVGTRVRTRRLMLGMSQTSLADSVGLTFQQIQKYESGANRISSSRLQQFSNILQVPVSFFFEGAPNAVTGELGAPANVSNFFASAEGLALASSFMKIKSGKVRRQIVDLVESLGAN